jgi:F-type H+-transporting ATPase subunit b
VKSLLRWGLLKQSLLVGLSLALVFGIGFQLSAARAQAAGASTQAAPVVAGAAESAKAPETQKAEQEGDDVYLKSPSVVWLGKKLGIGTDRASKLADIGNFVILAAAIIWVAAKSLPKLLRDRNATIQKHLVDARTATDEARARLSGVEDSVESEKKSILASAEQEISAATSHAQKQLQSYAAGLAIDQAASKLVVSTETDRLLVQGFALRLTGDGTKKEQN